MFLLNTGSLSQASVDLLDQFVRAGGGLFWGMGDLMDAEAFRAAGDLMPGRLRTLRDLRRPGHDAVSFKSYPSEHPIFRDIHIGNLATARFHAYAQLEGLRPDADVLLEFSDGSPALVSHRHGQGRVLWFASSLSERWNNFPFRPFYLPVLQQSVRYLADSLQPPLQRDHPVGTPVTLEVQNAAGLMVKRPDGVEVVPIDANADGAAPIFTDTRRAGLYRVFDGEGTHLPQADFLMRRDPAVSDLRRVDADEVARRLRAANFGAEVEGDGSERRRFDPMLMLLAVMGLTLMGEALVARRGLQ